MTEDLLPVTLQKSGDYYKLKYLKYKEKYLKLKKLSGGSCTIPYQCSYSSVVSFNDPNHYSISKEQDGLRKECIKCFESCCTIHNSKKNENCKMNQGCHIYFDHKDKLYKRTLTNVLSLGIFN